MKKNIIADVLSYIGWAAYIGFTAWGLVYVLKGNIPMAILFTISGIITLILIVSFLVKFKTEKRTYKNLLPEYTLISAYLVVAMLSFVFQFHTIRIDFMEKDQIKKAGIEKAATITYLQNAYDSTVKAKINSFTTQVETYLSSYLLASSGDRGLGYKDSLQVVLGRNKELYESYERGNMGEEAKNELRTIIKRDTEAKVKSMNTGFALGQVATDAEKYKNTATQAFINWEMFNVSFHYYNIDAEREKLYKAAQSKMPDFVYNSPTDTNPIRLDSASFSGASVGSWLLGLVFLLIVHLAILAPYLLAERAEYSRLVRRKKGNEPIEGDISNKFSQ